MNKIIILLVMGLLVLSFSADAFAKSIPSPASLSHNTKTIDRPDRPSPSPSPDVPTPKKVIKKGGGCVTLIQPATGVPYDIYFPFTGRIISGWSCTILEEYWDEDGTYHRRKVTPTYQSIEPSNTVLSVYWSNRKVDMERFYSRI